jgi:CDP-glucose 4,6-dehydratase
MAADTWRRRRVLVTGCTGLLGAWLTDWLVKAGADVVGLIRDRVPGSNFHRLGLDDTVIAVRGALEDAPLLERVVNEYEIEVVFHTAAQTLVGIANENPVSTFTANIAGTWNILEACRRSSRIKAIILASSDKAYGTHTELPYRETAPLIGRHPYDVSKSCSDLIGQAYWESYKLPVAITRCGNLYGGGDLNFNRIVPGTVRSLLDGQRPIVRSDGTLIRDYFFVKDAVHAYVMLAERVLAGQARGEAYNFSNEIQMTVLELVALISELTGRPDLPPVVQSNAPNEIPHQYLSAEKARTELGWRATYSMREALADTIAWYRDYFAATPDRPKEARR